MLSQVEFEKRIRDQGNGEYKVVGVYAGRRKPVEVVHSCGYHWNMIHDAFFKGNRCPSCGNRLPITNTDFQQRVFELGNGEYETLSSYSKSNVPVHLTHICGYDWWMTPSHWLAGERCPKCAGRPKVNTEEYKKRVSLLSKDYRVLGKYVNRKTRIKMLHVSGNHIFECSPDEFLKGNRCPICRQSHGELEIQQWLDEEGFLYDAQHPFPFCVDKKPLPFDFYLPDHNTCIEFDGIQHFEPIEFFGGQEAFELRHKHDLIKNQYCKDNQITLLRIPYTENVEDFLNANLPQKRGMA